MKNQQFFRIVFLYSISRTEIAVIIWSEMKYCKLCIASVWYFWEVSRGKKGNRGKLKST